MILHWKMVNFLKHSSKYYPQGNNLVESTNTNSICIINKMVYSEHRIWHNALVKYLRDDNVTPKPSLKTSHYFLMYRK